jgi:flagellar basal-body rod modification protein FlgD
VAPNGRAGWRVRFVIYSSSRLAAKFSGKPNYKAINDLIHTRRNNHMSSIGTSLPTTTLPNTTAASTSNSTASTASADGSNSLGSQSTFLQLLVAQLQNQDPTQPVQGTEFVTQLATFSDVEQNLAVRQDVDAISNKMLGSVPSGGSVAATATTAASSTATNTSATDAISAAAAAAAAAAASAAASGAASTLGS